MNQWEKYDADMLLDIADSTNAPGENDDPWGSVIFDGKDEWKVSIFYDCGELDYIEHFVAPDGEIIDFWKWPDTYLPNGDYDHDLRHPRNRLMAWRGVRRPETEEKARHWLPVSNKASTSKPSPWPSWPLMGYAPGKYRISACSACGDEYDGDKYSWHCLPCAVRAANAEMERLRGERTLAAMSPKERAGIMREIAAAIGTGGVLL
jgi:hypothetical protein